MKRVAARIALFLLLLPFILTSTPAFSADRILEWEGNLSAQKEEFIKLVDAREEWIELWQRAFKKPAPEVDFEKKVVACVFMGHSARWHYSIQFDEPLRRDNEILIYYSLHDVKLRMSGPFKAGGQYHMKVFEKQKGVPTVLKEGGSTAQIRWR